MHRRNSVCPTLRILERADTGRNLCLSQENDGQASVLPAGTVLLAEAPLVALATDHDCCDNCMTTGLGEQAGVFRRRYRCQACGLNYCSERCRRSHTADECAAFVEIDRAVGRQHSRNAWLRLVARTCLCTAAREVLPSFCHHAADKAKAADDAALLSGLLSTCWPGHSASLNACATNSDRHWQKNKHQEHKEQVVPELSEEWIQTCWCVLRCNVLTIHDDAERSGERHLGWYVPKYAHRTSFSRSI